MSLAQKPTRFPKVLGTDRISAYEQWSVPLERAADDKLRLGRQSLATGEWREGAYLFAEEVAVTEALPRMSPSKGRPSSNILRRTNNQPRLARETQVSSTQKASGL